MSKAYDTKTKEKRRKDNNTLENTSQLRVMYPCDNSML